MQVQSITYKCAAHPRQVVKDYSRSKLTYHRFWQRMAREKRADLFDQFGGGPRDQLYLPTDIRGMADDPYRSLAWMARKAGGYENSPETFAEFAGRIFSGNMVYWIDADAQGFTRRSPKARGSPVHCASLRTTCG